MANDIKSNQSEQEFFAVAETGRKGLQEMADKMGGEIMAIAAKSVADAGPTWIKRAIVSIANNDKLADVIKTKTGLFSIYKCLAKSATMGLQIGGQFPQAHLVPFSGSAELIIDANGYKHAALNGPGAVLSDFTIVPVYDGEDFKIDFAKAEVVHAYDGKNPKGKLTLIYGIMTRTDGRKAVAYMTRAEIENIRDGHSRAWKDNKPTPWKSDFDMMAMKTAAKRFLKPYASEAEGLAMLFSQDRDEDAITDPPKDNRDRMSERLSRQVERLSSVAQPHETVEGEFEEIQEQGNAAGGMAAKTDIF